MYKYIPIIIPVAFWGIFLWGLSTPKVGDAIMTITFVGGIIGILMLVKKVMWKLVGTSDSKDK